MDERIESVELTVVTVARGMDAEDGLATLEHLDEYEPSDRFSNRLSSLPGTDPDSLEGTHWLFADHVPSAFDVQAAEPNLFLAEYVEAGLAAGFTARRADVEAFLDALEQLLAATELDLGQFRVVAEVDADVRDGDSIEDVPEHPAFLNNLRVDTDAGRSEVDLVVSERGSYDLAEPGDADALRDRFDEAVAHVEDLLPAA
jgi:hypothetical protein